MVLQTEYEFTLPRGFVDEKGDLHQKGVMRLATAADEILPMKDPRVQNNPPYLTVILLSRVISRLGEVRDVNPGVVEKLFVTDLTYLQELYRRINGDGNVSIDVKCPHCGETFAKEITAPGE
ncbi:MAG: phage tail assembly protein [Candidatus Aminicenantes bacterium]|jgi:PHP family Zn ribbon phosphoesterase|nr:phage tail assembly protein [Candidatus Aminicenantes bacterium]